MERKQRVGRQNRTSVRSNQSHRASRSVQWLLRTLCATFYFQDCFTKCSRHIQPLSIFTYLNKKKQIQKSQNFFRGKCSVLEIVWNEFYEKLLLENLLKQVRSFFENNNDYSILKHRPILTPKYGQKIEKHLQIEKLQLKNQQDLKGKNGEKTTCGASKRNVGTWEFFCFVTSKSDKKRNPPFDFFQKSVLENSISPKTFV